MMARIAPQNGGKQLTRLTKGHRGLLAGFRFDHEIADVGE